MSSNNQESAILQSLMDGFTEQAELMGISKEAAGKMAGTYMENMGNSQIPQGAKNITPSRFKKFVAGAKKTGKNVVDEAMRKAEEFQKGYNAPPAPKEIKLKPKAPAPVSNSPTPGAGKASPGNTRRAPKPKPGAIVPRNADVVNEAPAAAAPQSKVPRIHNQTFEAQAAPVVTPDEVIPPSKGTTGVNPNSPKLNNQAIDIESSPTGAAPTARAGLPQASPTTPQAAPQPTSAAGNFMGGVKQKATNAWRGAKAMANNVVNKFNAARAGQGGGGAPPTPPTGGAGVPPAGGSPTPGARNLAKGVGTAGKVLTGLGSAAAGLNAVNEFSDGNYGKGAVSAGQAAMPILSKVLAQSAPRAIPGIGAGLSFGSAASRLHDKDYLGAGLDALSGVASGVGAAFPPAAAVASPIALGLTGANAARDIYKGFNQPEASQAPTAGAQGVVNAAPGQAQPKPSQPAAPASSSPAPEQPAAPTQPLHTLSADKLNEMYAKGDRQPITTEVPLPEPKGNKMPTRAGAIGAKSPGTPTRAGAMNASTQPAGTEQKAAPQQEIQPPAKVNEVAAQPATQPEPVPQQAPDTQAQPQQETKPAQRPLSHYERGAQVLNQGVSNNAITPAKAQASIQRMPGEERERAKMIAAGGSPAAVDAWMKEKASRGPVPPTKAAEFDALLEGSIVGFKKMAEELGVDEAFARGMLGESLVDLYKQAEAKLINSKVKKAELAKVADYNTAWEGFKEALVNDGATDAFIEGMMKEANDSLSDDRHRILPFMSNNMLGAGGGALLGSAISRGFSDDDDDGPGIGSMLLPMAGAVAGQHFLPKLMNSWKDPYGTGANAANTLTAAFNKANPVMSSK